MQARTLWYNRRSRERAAYGDKLLCVGREGAEERLTVSVWDDSGQVSDVRCEDAARECVHGCRRAAVAQMAGLIGGTSKAEMADDMIACSMGTSERRAAHCCCPPPAQATPHGSRRAAPGPGNRRVVQLHCSASQLYVRCSEILTSASNAGVQRVAVRAVPPSSSTRDTRRCIQTIDIAISITDGGYSE